MGYGRDIVVMYGVSPTQPPDDDGDSEFEHISYQDARLIKVELELAELKKELAEIKEILKTIQK